MPSGKIHRKWHLIGYAPVVCAGVYLAVTNPESSGYVAAGLVGYILGDIIEPDLDQIGITASEGRVIRILGLPGVFWAAYWLPYAWIMPHRSFFSHFPGISTITRMIYIFTIPLLALWYYNLLQPWMVGVLFWLWVGLTLSDIIHWCLDTLN